VVIVVAGPSGAGKGSIVSRLLELDPRLWLSRSWTTRPRRVGEAEDAYVWVDRDTFLAHAERGGFLEWFEVYGDLKGTPRPDPPSGHDILLEIDLQGARVVQETVPDTFVVFVRPPSRAEQERRMRARGDDDASVERRLAKGDVEEALGPAIADHVVVNDDLDRAVEEVAGAIAEARRARPHR
jgi:guanylate kinase